MTRVAFAVLALVVSTICCTASASESFDPSALITPPNLRTATYMLPMRDGILLHTDVDFPPFYINDTNPKKIPCVLERSPYGQNAIERIAQIAGDLLGYCAVRQDMRGTHDSQGNFSIWHDSANDAYDTIEWIISQPWSNGQVFETGASADGIDQFAQIIKPHPALRGQFVVVATTEGYETFFVGGSFRYALIDGWLNGTVPTQSAELEKFVLTKEQPDLPWWDCVNGTKYYQNVNWPSMMYAGWYDIFQQGNLRAWEGYQYHSNPAVRGQSKLVIDPCGHCQVRCRHSDPDKPAFVDSSSIRLPISWCCFSTVRANRLRRLCFPGTPSWAGPSCLCSWRWTSLRTTMPSTRRGRRRRRTSRTSPSTSWPPMNPTLRGSTGPRTFPSRPFLSEGRLDRDVLMGMP